MPYLVRKLIKRDKLSDLESHGCIGELLADVPTTEFRTKDGTLSTWRIESIEELGEAVLAIAVSSTEISKMDFIVINTELLDKYQLSYNCSYAGIDLPVPDLQDSHYDIVGVTLDKLKDCACLYKEILTNETDEGKYIVRFTQSEIKSLLKQAIASDRVDKSKASKKIRELIDTLSA